MENVIGILADIASVLALFLSGFAVYRVNKIEQKITQPGNNNKALSQNAKGNNNTQIGLQ